MRHTLGYALLLILCSCASETVTHYSLPPTPGGRLCVHQCEQARDYGQQRCDWDYRACYANMQATAQRDYEGYLNQHRDDPDATQTLPSRFEHPEACQSRRKSCIASCATPYAACYQSCGGTVTVTSSCSFLCFE